MKIELRKATDKDIPAIFGLIRELAIYEDGLDRVTNSEEQMQAEKDFYNCYLAEHDGKIIGMALYYFAYYTWVGKSLYLDDLFVKEEYRGKKIGSQLMQKMMDVAREEKCSRLRLQVLNWNSSAIEFYKKSGFMIDQEWYNCDYIDF
ncbi:GNAT family N-acetyltransferase [Maribellus mangrovi]|uniref:GNAT family N-acetyltransferase n=1 Tax=Maribellus mangrovi TaxID=3133146 RepID=UPI0030EE7EDA